MHKKGLQQIFDLSAKGESIEKIAANLGIPPDEVVLALKRLSQLPSQPQIKPKYVCKLTAEARIRGYANSRKAYKDNMEERRKLLRRHILQAGKPAITASLAYYLAKGSEKEFLVTVISPEVGQLFLTALRKIGAPVDAIQFCWRHHDKTTLPNGWQPLMDLISFDKTTIHSMRLRVRPFKVGNMKISGRSLAMGFLAIGKGLVAHVAAH